jgi:hypothetical protein
VTAVTQVAAPVGRPDHDVRDARTDLLVAAGAPVRLDGRLTGDGAHPPLPIRPGLDRLDASAHPLGVQRLGVV